MGMAMTWFRQLIDTEEKRNALACQMARARFVVGGAKCHICGGTDRSLPPCVPDDAE